MSVLQSCWISDASELNQLLTLHLDGLAWLDPAAVWPDAVLLRCGRLDFECDGLLVRV